MKSRLTLIRAILTFVQRLLDAEALETDTPNPGMVDAADFLDASLDALEGSI